MIDTFNLSDDQFSLYTSIVFGFAALISPFCPYIIRKMGLYNSMTFASISVTVGHVMFLCALFYVLENKLSITSSIIIQYCGRIFIGIGYGIQNITIYTTVNIWFKDNQWLEFAINCVNITFDLGMLTVRYCILPLYRVSGSNLFIAYSLGFMLSVLSIIGCIMMQKYENIYIKKAQQALATEQIETERALTQQTTVSDTSLHVELDSDLRKIRHFNLKIWLIIIYIVIGWSAVETFINQFTLPLMIYFNITEEYANILLSASSLCALTLGLFWGWIISKYGYLSYYLMSSMFLFFLCLLIIQIYGLMDLELENVLKDSNYVVVWIAIACFITGIQHYFVSSFACLFTVTPVEYSSIANSITAFLFLLGSMLESYLFGILVVSGDNVEGKNYNWSILMLNITIVVGLVCAISVHFLDVIEDGPLHKSVAGNSECDQEIESELDVYQMSSDGENDTNVIQERKPLLSDTADILSISSTSVVI